VIFTSLDITERKNAELQVEKERNRAELYLDLLSHDLGNIHQGIISWVKLCTLHEDDPDFMKMSWENVSELSRKSIQLTRNIKLISRLNEREPEMERIDLKESIERSIERAMSIDPSKNAVVDHNLPEKPIPIMAEPLIDEVFFNIIHNGIKFQENDVWIGIDIDIGDDRIRIQIADRGPGISDEFKEMIFERTKMGSKHKHMGIGLSLVKELVSRYDGTIKVEDRIDGKTSHGSCFIMVFPRA
jgi:K+-sensing histidine kinase KdpD